MKEIYGDINNNKATIVANDSLIQGSLIKKSENDSILYGGSLSETDSIELINQNTSLIQQVNVSISETRKMLIAKSGLNLLQLNWVFQKHNHA